MKFGTFFFFQWPPGHSAPDVIHRELEQMEWTEELGFDQIWITEHHFIDYGLSVDPPLLAASAASRTKRVRIGLAAAILPFQYPIRLAEQLALVDIISNGRLDVGVGRGNRPAEFAGYGVPQVENRERFQEVRDIMIKAWTEETVSYDGKFHQFSNVRVIPKPLQQPHPPLYAVCSGPETIQATGRQAIPMLNSVLHGTTEKLVTNRDLYAKTMKENGYDGAEVSAALAKWGVSRQIYVAPTDGQA